MCKSIIRCDKQSTTEFLKEVLVIGAPVVVQSVLGSLVNMLDVMMIGQLGEVAITASAVSNQWFTLFALLANALCAAGSMFISQHWGKRELNSIHRYIGILFYGVVSLGLLFGISALTIPEAILTLYSRDALVLEQAAGYLRILGVSFLIDAVSIVFITGLRSIGDTKVPMIASAASVITNGILNYIMIFGTPFTPALGIHGAAVATVIARIVELLIVIVYVFRKKPPVYCKLREYLSVPAALWKKYFKVGFWVIIAEVLIAFGNTMYSMAYKYTGTEGQAALQIINTYQNLALIMCGGFGTAAAVMIGIRLGKNEFEEAKRCCRKLLVVGVVVSLCITLIVVLISPLLLGVFRVGETVSGYLKIMIIMMAFAVPLKFMNYLCIVGVLRSGGDSTYCFIANMVGVWVVGLPLVWLCAVYFELPIYVVYLMANMEDVGKFLISFPRVIRNKWVKNLT